MVLLQDGLEGGDMVRCGAAATAKEGGAYVCAGLDNGGKVGGGHVIMGDAVRTDHGNAGIGLANQRDLHIAA